MAGIRGVIASGVPPAEVAVLVRINAQLPAIEEALTRAGIGFSVRGQRFYERTEVRQARQLLARAHLTEVGPQLLASIRGLFEDELGLTELGEEAGDEARERAAALELLLGIIADLATRDPALTLASVRAELDRRDAAEAAAVQDGVNLLTYHRAKGLEWDAVFLPALEEGLLPVRQAKDEDAIAEERRLLYVGVTRARRYLTLSWAARRVTPGGKVAARQPSRFLVALALRSSEPVRASLQRPERQPATAADPVLLGRLQSWRRERARRDGVPAYVIAEDATLAAVARQGRARSRRCAASKGSGPSGWNGMGRRSSRS